MIAVDSAARNVAASGPALWNLLAVTEVADVFLISGCKCGRCSLLLVRPNSVCRFQRHEERIFEAAVYVKNSLGRPVFFDPVKFMAGVPLTITP